jgi:hypothetical protein
LNWLESLLGCCHCMSSKWLAPIIDYWQPPLLNELEFGSHQCWQQSKNSCHEMPINRGIMREQNERVKRRE